jgi:hypothetical protein
LRSGSSNCATAVTKYGAAIGETSVVGNFQKAGSLAMRLKQAGKEMRHERNDSYLRGGKGFVNTRTRDGEQGSQVDAENRLAVLRAGSSVDHALDAGP